MEVGQIIPLEHEEQIADDTVPQMTAKIAEVQVFVKQIVDVTAPQIIEKVDQVVQIIPQARAPRLKTSLCVRTTRKLRKLRRSHHMNAFGILWTSLRTT